MFISIQEFVSGLPSLSYLRNNNFNLVEIIEYCNGLLLCYCYNSVTFVKSYIICNHLTKEHAVLPSHDRLLTTYCLLILHILTICNIRLFVFAMSKKKKHLIYIVYFLVGNEWVGEFWCQTSTISCTKWVQKWCLTMTCFGIVLRDIFLYATWTKKADIAMNISLLELGLEEKLTSMYRNISTL